MPALTAFRGQKATKVSYALLPLTSKIKLEYLNMLDSLININQDHSTCQEGFAIYYQPELPKFSSLQDLREFIPEIRQPI